MTKYMLKDSLARHRSVLYSSLHQMLSQPLFKYVLCLQLKHMRCYLLVNAAAVWHLCSALWSYFTSMRATPSVLNLQALACVCIMMDVVTPYISMLVGDRVLSGSPLTQHKWHVLVAGQTNQRRIRSCID